MRGVKYLVRARARARGYGARARVRARREVQLLGSRHADTLTRHLRDTGRYGEIKGEIGRYRGDIGSRLVDTLNEHLSVGLGLGVVVGRAVG